MDRIEPLVKDFKSTVDGISTKVKQLTKDIDKVNRINYSTT